MYNKGAVVGLQGHRIVQQRQTFQLCGAREVYNLRDIGNPVVGEHNRSQLGQVRAQCRANPGDGVVVQQQSVQAVHHGKVVELFDVIVGEINHIELILQINKEASGEVRDEAWMRA